jgi:hypothetical protein
MLEAGNKGATEVIPLLRKHLSDSDDPAHSGTPGNWQPRQAAQLALAKLGDKTEHQEIGCELFYGNPAEQSTAFYKLEYVGGWFEISRLAHFLLDTEENSRQMKGAVESDDYCESYVASLPNRPDSHRVVKVDGEIRIISVEHRGFGTRPGNASFNGKNVPIREWTDTRITLELPSHTDGELMIIKADSKTLTIAVHL